MKVPVDVGRLLDDDHDYIVTVRAVLERTVAMHNEAAARRPKK